MDGNTVDMDVERGQMAENALQYDVPTRLMSDKIQGSRPPSLPNPDRRCVGESVQRLPYFFQCDDRTVDAPQRGCLEPGQCGQHRLFDGKPYRAKQVVFEAIPVAGGNEGRRAYGSARSSRTRAPPRLVYDPKNPAADEKGYVAFPNVNVVEEMTNMISASRSYQSNVEVMNTAKSMMMRTLQIGQ